MIISYRNVSPLRYTPEINIILSDNCNFEIKKKRLIKPPMREKGPSSSVGIHYLTGINSCLLHSWSTPALGTVICKAVKPSPPCPDGVLRPEVGREAGTRGFSLQGQTLAELRSEAKFSDSEVTALCMPGPWLCFWGSFFSESLSIFLS